MRSSAPMASPTAASLFLRQLAARIAAAYDATPSVTPRALLLTGSAAAGLSDEHSDLDLIAYHAAALPAPAAFAPVRAALGAPPRPPAADDTGWLEVFTLDGVECQIAHIEITEWEQDLARVLTAHTPGTTIEKAISGLLAGIPLRGVDLIAGWQARAAIYPPALAQATIQHYLRFFPFWRTSPYWLTRDAPLFYYQTLTDTCLNLLGVLAGLNHRYYSTFQPTRLHRFVASLPLAPPDLAGRLTALLTLPPAAAGDGLLALVMETLALVEQHAPAADISAARQMLTGGRQPWRLPTPDERGPD